MASGAKLGLGAEMVTTHVCAQSTTMYSHPATYVIWAAAPATCQLRCLSHVLSWLGSTGIAYWTLSPKRTPGGPGA